MTTLSLHITADASGLAAIKQATDELRTLLVSSGGYTDSSTAKLKVDLAGVASAARVASLEVDSLSKATGRLNASGVAGVASSVARITPELNKATKSSNDLHSAMRGVAGASGALWTTYGSMVPLVAAFAVAAAAIKTVKLGSEFEYITQYTVALANATGEATGSVEQLRSEILGISGTMQGPKDLAIAIKELSKAGFETEESLGGIKSIANLATVAEEDLKEMTVAVSSQFRAWNETIVGSIRGVSSMSEVANILGFVAGKTALDVGELTKQMAYATELAPLSGVSFTELSAAMGWMSNMGIHGTKAMTSLRTAILDLEDPTSKSRGLMKALGVEFTAFNADGSPKNLVAMFKDLGASIKHLNSEAQIKILDSLLGGMRNLKGGASMINALKENLQGTGTQLEALIAGAAEAGKNLTYLDSMIAKLGETAQGKWKLLLPELEKAMIKAFDSKPVMGLIDALTTAAKDGTVGRLIDGIAQVSGGLIWAATKAIEFKDEILALGAAWVASKIAGAVLSLVGYLQKAAAAQWALNIAMDANPVGLVITAIAALGAGAYVYFKSVEDGKKVVDATFVSAAEKARDAEIAVKGLTGEAERLSTVVGTPAAPDGILENLKNFLAAPVISSAIQKVMDFFKEAAAGTARLAPTMRLGGTPDAEEPQLLVNSAMDATIAWFKSLTEEGKKARGEVERLAAVLKESYIAAPQDNGVLDYNKNLVKVYDDLTVATGAQGVVDEAARVAAEKLAKADQLVLDKLLPLAKEQREYNEALAVLDRMDPSHSTDEYVEGVANLGVFLTTAQKAAKKLAEADQNTLDRLLPLVKGQREYNEALAVLDRMDPSHSTEAYVTALANLDATLTSAGKTQKDLTKTTEDYHAALLASLPEEEAAVIKLTDAYDQQRASVTAALEQEIITASEAAQVMAGLSKQQEIDIKEVSAAFVEQAAKINSEAEATKSAAAVHAEKITEMMRSYRQLNAGMTEHQIEIDNLSAAIEEAIVTGRELGMTENELSEIRQAGIEMARQAIEEQQKAAFDLAKSFLQAAAGMTDFQVQQDNLKQSILAAALAADNAGATWATLNSIIEGGNILLAQAAAAHRQQIDDTLASYRQINAGMSDLEITLDNLARSTEAAIRAGREMGMTESELAEIRRAGEISAQRLIEEEAARATEAAAEAAKKLAAEAEAAARAMEAQAEATRQAAIAAQEAAYAVYLSSREIMTRVRQLGMTEYERTKQTLFFEYVNMGNAPGVSQSEQEEIMHALANELKKLAAEHALAVTNMLTPYRQINAGMSEYQIKLASIVTATEEAIRAGRALGLSESELTEIRTAGKISLQRAREEERAATAAAAAEARNKLIDKLQSAYDREASIFQSTIEQFEGFSDSLKSFRAGLKGGDLSTLNPEQKYLEAQADFADISRRAKLGDVEAIAQLEASAQAFLEASRGYNASGATYAADFAKVTAVLDATIKLSDRQSDIAHKQLDALTSQVAGLLKVNAAVETVAEILRAIHAGSAIAGKTPAPKFADGGYHSGGLRLVGEHGPELEYTGPSRIINANDTRSMISGGNNAELIAEIKALRREIIVELRADKTQRGAVGQATINRLEQVADKLDKQDRTMNRKVG